MFNPSCYKLPFRFDVKRLREDVRRVLAVQEWMPHDEWHAIDFHSVGGKVSNLRQKRGKFAATPLLNECPYFREVMDAFKCQKQRVRLFRLKPGGAVTEHIDSTDMTYHFGTVRFHIPIFTNPDVETVIDGVRVDLHPGEIWYIDTSYVPHGVVNRGSEDRIHFVIDCVVNDWVREQVPSSFGAPRWRRPFAYHARRIRFAYRKHSFPGAVLGECALAFGLFKRDPKEFASRTLAVLRWWRAP